MGNDWKVWNSPDYWCEGPETHSKTLKSKESKKSTDP